MSTKCCPKCREIKPFTTEFFYKINKDQQVLHTTCKTCMSQAAKKYKAKNPKKWIDRITQTRITPVGKSRVLLFTYQKIDKDRNLICDLDASWILQNIVYKVCVYCGEKDFLKLGCDRLDNSKAHTKDNVVPCCSDCNRLRWDIYTHKEMLEIGVVVRQIKDSRK